MRGRSTVPIEEDPELEERVVELMRLPETDAAPDFWPPLTAAIVPALRPR